MKIGILHTAFIGDVILSGLLIEALSIAGHEIIYFTKKNTANLFNQDVRIKKVIEIEKGKGLNKILSIKKIAKQIEEEVLDILLVPHRSSTSTLCAYFSKVKIKVGFQTASFSFLYNKKVHFPKNKHECVRYLNLLNDEIVDKSIVDKCKELGRPLLKYSDEAFLNFHRKFSANVFSFSAFRSNDEKIFSQIEPVNIRFEEILKNFFILAVGSVWKTKKYPIEHWVEVVFNILLQYPDYYCVLTGSKVDEADVELFIDLFRKKLKGQTQHSHMLTKVISTINLFSLFEFALFTSYAKFVLSNDSSPVHFASAFNIPVFAVFGPTVTEFGFAPTSTQGMAISYENENGARLSCQPCSMHGKNICPKGHHKCMKDLLPLTLIKAINKFMLDLKA